MGEVYRTPEDPADQIVMFKDERDGVRRMIEKGSCCAGHPTTSSAISRSCITVTERARIKASSMARVDVLCTGPDFG